MDSVVVGSSSSDEEDMWRGSDFGTENDGNKLLRIRIAVTDLWWTPPNTALNGPSASRTW
jgi:hypothetical protein